MIEDILTQYICQRFLSDDRYRNGHIQILAPSPGTKVLGLHTPQMKKVAKELSREPYEVLNGFEMQLATSGKTSLYHDERMVWGLILDYAKIPLETRLKRIRKFLPSIDNWAICDNFCCNAKWVEKEDKEAVWDFLEDLFGTSSSDDNYEFTVRTALVLTMCHCLDEASLQRTFRRLYSLGLKEGEPYYIRMGVAWLLATALAKHPDETRGFMAEAPLPKDIVKLYVRKARESRVTRDISPFFSGS